MSQDSALAAAKQWQELSNKFETLAKEEQTQAGPRLKAIATPISSPLGDVGEWRLDGAISDKIRERFALIGTQAGFALGTPPGGANILHYWLHRLCQNVCDRATAPHVFPPRETPSFWIENVCEESSTFCIGLQRQALAGQADCGTLADCFSKWIDDNSSGVEPFYWSTPGSLQNWISCVAKCAKASIPIHFLSARLNVNGLRLRPSEHTSLRPFFDQIAKEHELIWCITRSGIWIAQQPPKSGAYIDASGRRQGDGIDDCASESAYSGSSQKGDKMSPTLPQGIPNSQQAWRLIEQDYTLRLSLVANEWATEHLREWNAVFAEGRRRGNASYYGPALVEMEIADADKRAEWAFNTCCEVWEVQGRTKCRAFFRAVFDWCLQPMFSTREDSIRHGLELHQKRTAAKIPQGVSAICGHMKREMGKLRAKWNTKLEIATRDHEYQEQSAQKSEAQQRRAMIAPVPVPAYVTIPNTPKKRTTTKRALSDRKRYRIVFGAIEDRLKGVKYCGELDRKGLRSPRAWQLDGCPKTYTDAYKIPKWRQRLQDEKSRFNERYKKMPAVERHAIIQGTRRTRH